MDRFIKKEFWWIRDEDLQKLILDCTGLSFDIAADFGLDNGDYYPVQVNKDLSEEDFRVLKYLLDKKMKPTYRYHLDLVMTHLCILDIIEPGDYLVEIYQ